MAVLHRSPGGHYYIKAPIDGKVVTLQLRSEGVSWLSAKNIKAGGNITPVILNNLINSGFVYTRKADPRQKDLFTDVPPKAGPTSMNQGNKDVEVQPKRLKTATSGMRSLFFLAKEIARRILAVFKRS